MQFGFESSFVGQLRLLLRDQRRREGLTESIFDDLVILARTKQKTDRRLFMSFADVTVERLKVERQLAEELRFKSSNLELNRHQTVQASVEEEKIERKIATSHLQGELRTYKAKVAPEFDEELLELAQETLVQIRLLVYPGKLEELDGVCVSEDVEGFGIISIVESTERQTESSLITKR